MPYDHFHNGSHSQPMSSPSVLIPSSLTDAVARVVELIRRREKFNIGVAETQYFPFSSICRLRLDFPDETSMFQGTGFYISPNLILTAGHNFISNGGQEATKITVQPGFNNGNTFPEIEVGPSDWKVHPKFRNGGDVGFDMGVIRVKKGPPDGKYFHLINHSPAPGTTLALSGYGLSDSASSRVQHLDIATFKGLSNNNEMLEFDIYALGGNSGSPCFIDFEPNRSGGYTPAHLPVMAILQGGPTDLSNRGVLLTPEKIDWAKAGVPRATSHSLSATRPQLGGLPLMSRSRKVLGGLPLQPASPMVPAVSQSYSRPLSRSWIVVDENNGMSVARRTFGHPTHDLTGKTTLSVRVPNMPDGGSVRWHIPNETHRTRVMFESGSGTSASASGTSVTLLSLDGGPAAVDCMVKDASGTTVESNKYWVSSPQFVFVAIHPTVDAFYAGIGLGGRTANIYAEMKATMRHLYRNVNVRLVFPGDTLPVHLGLSSDPAWPGGVQTVPSVYYSETLGDETVMDPEASKDAGTPTPYRAGIGGRNHQPGDMAAPFNQHSLARSLIHRFVALPDVAAIQAAASAGTLSAADTDRAVLMYGRLMGENAAHEVGHFMSGNFVSHDTAGFMQSGGGRTFTERTGMTRNASVPLLTDGGRAAVNNLSADLLHAFEDFLAVRPPLDEANLSIRGRVGSFSMSTRGGYLNGWQNRPVSQPMSGETVHLPGATVLEGWQAEAFIRAIETAFRAALSTLGPTAIWGSFVSVDDILTACDNNNVTIGLGTALGGGIQGGGSGGFGIVFAPGRKIGFYGTYSGIVGWIYSAALNVQLTVVKGNEANFGGPSTLVGGAVETIGWFDTGLLGIPVGAHTIYNAQNQAAGYVFEIGIGAGVPVISLVELYGQSAETVTTFGYQSPSYGRALTAATEATDGREAALNTAISAGATPEEAAAFVDALFH